MYENVLERVTLLSTSEQDQDGDLPESRITLSLLKHIINVVLRGLLRGFPGLILESVFTIHSTITRYDMIALF